MSDYLSLVHNNLLWLGIFSVLCFIGSLIAIPIILVNIPADYFIEKTRQKRRAWLTVVGQIIKNVLGIIFLLAGILMLFLPGQGLLTILIGLSFLDFPGKRALEIRLIRRPQVQKSINWLRHKYGRPALLIP